MSGRRLLHVAQPVDAGVARVVAALAAAQVAQGHEVSVACPPGGHLADDVRDAGATWLPWSATRDPGPSVAGETVRLRSAVRRARPELVHLHSAKAGLAGRLLLRGRTPTAFTPHAWSFDAVEGLTRRAALGWERRAARWTSLLVCVSAAELSRGEQLGVRVRDTAVVANGVDLERFPAPRADDRRRARSRLGVGDGPLAVCVGRLARQKGQDVLLAAWPEVTRHVPEATLVLVGEGPERAALTAQAAALGRGVSLVGAADVRPWMLAADVVVVPSRWEGMALVPLEAMATARSVVASDVTGMQESLPAGAGALVAPEDPGALAAAVADRLSGRVDPAAEGRYGRAHVRASHDARVAADAVTAAYARVLP